MGCSDGVVYRWWDLGVGGLGVVGRFGGGGSKNGWDLDGGHTYETTAAHGTARG